MRSRRAAGALLFVCGVLGAQERAPFAPQWEFRPGLALTPEVTGSIGLGLNVRSGWYARSGIAVAAGLGAQAPWRAELTARFLLDPFAERRLGLYGGGGVGLAGVSGGTSRGELLLLVGAEWPRAARVVPALELTLGGGLRATFVLRSRREVGR